jgi:molybdate transport system substrate-binding protein
MDCAARCLVGVSLIASVVGCADGPTVPAKVAARRVPLRIAAASDLQTALPVLGERFTRQTGVELSLTFGASGQLAEQIKGGAPFDVFLAANQSFVKRLADQGDVRPGSVRAYALGSLVLAVYADTGGAIGSITDLTRPEVKRIALANPAIAPYGAAGKQAIERAKLWDALQPRIVQSESVRQTLQLVETGNAEAGFVGRSIARASQQVRVVEVDRELYDPIVQGLGIVARTSRAGDAQRFCDFLLSVEGQDGLREFGFAPAPPAPGLPASQSPGRTLRPTRGVRARGG